jgi:hypothetical protein
MKHRRRKQREHAGQQAPHRRRDGHRARGVQLERIDQVVQRHLEDGQRADPDQHGRDAGANPVDASAGRLAEEEEACGKEERADRHRREPRFGDGARVVADVLAVVEGELRMLRRAPRAQPRRVPAKGMELTRGFQPRVSWNSMGKAAKQL